MISPLVGHITLGIYAALLAVGGIMGFVKARSRPSLITGLASAVAALVALWFSTLRSPFGYRYALRNRQFMPSGMMAVVSLVVLGVMFMVLDWSR